MKLRECFLKNLHSYSVIVAVLLNVFIACVTWEFAMAAEPNSDPPKVVLSYAPTDEEVLKELLLLAGEAPDRQRAVHRWNAIKGIDLFTYHEDHIVQIHCEDVALQAGDLHDLCLFPEITSLYFKETPLSSEILKIISQHTTLEELFIHGDSSVNNKICDVAQKLPNLWNVVIDSSKIDDMGLRHLAEQGTLTALSLSNAQITSDGLHHLQACDGLTHLILDGNAIQDDGLTHLSELSKLICLNLERTKISDQGLKHLKNTLGYLNIGGTMITDHSAGVLAEFNKLAHLSLNDTRITNRTVSLLPNLPKLAELSLRNTSIDDLCIPDLERIEKLRRLDIRDTNISRTGAKRIRAALKESAILECDFGHLPRPGAPRKTELLRRQPYAENLPKQWFESSFLDDLDGVWVPPAEHGTGYHTALTVIKNMEYACYRYNKKEMDPEDDITRRGPILGNSGVYFFPNKASLYGPTYIAEANGYKFMMSNKESYEEFVKSGAIPKYVLIRVADKMDFKSPPKRPSLRVLGTPLQSRE